MLGLLEPGDEVVVFEPLYDSYAATSRWPAAGGGWSPCTRRTGASTRTAGAAVTPRTRLLLLNSPHNPTGQVFSRDELSVVAEVCRPATWSRSATRSTSTWCTRGRTSRSRPWTGWPTHADRLVARQDVLGDGLEGRWAGGPASLVGAVRAAKQFLSFAGATPFQVAGAAAGARRRPPRRARGVVPARARDRLCAGCEAAGLRAAAARTGAYFVHARVAARARSSVASCRCARGSSRIPTAVFYDSAVSADSLVRFAFCKREAVIDEAAARLAGAGAVTGRTAAG